jgi:hypothetical protein
MNRLHVSMLASRLKRDVENCEDLSYSFLYEKPTAGLTSESILQLQKPGLPVIKSLNLADKLSQLVELYSQVKLHKRGDADVSGETVLLSGAAGSLGVQVLVKWLRLKKY